VRIKCDCHPALRDPSPVLARLAPDAQSRLARCLNSATSIDGFTDPPSLRAMIKNCMGDVPSEPLLPEAIDVVVSRAASVPSTALRHWDYCQETWTEH
jgi:hypothetical protein